MTDDLEWIDGTPADWDAMPACFGGRGRPGYDCEAVYDVKGRFICYVEVWTLKARGAVAPELRDIPLASDSYNNVDPVWCRKSPDAVPIHHFEELLCTHCGVPARRTPSHSGPYPRRRHLPDDGGEF